ncbi:hypothetical protein BJY21_003626 [Kineosphaera limosa]|uniref:Putative phosphatase n=1 Tax=Kineosphaera limosa NBRC 100340 TaxID=1184609 RepID=K6WQC7_9MICO|nr:Cof-type HAD-IIB family hydrolase [Kineosphaera limosa]NYE02442.1 hypothetical protein [Kineosphaera limosa]GAB96031.1 putative phosphatase [Kineosphaera limosa NBRC 100340]
MTRTPSLIAVDIDGTLLSSTGRVLPGTRAEFARAQQAGATIALVSGRPVAGLRRLMHRLQLEGAGFVHVGSNGSRSADAQTGEVLTSHTLGIDVVHEVVALCKEHGITVMLCDGDDLVVDRPQDRQVVFEAEGNDLRIRAVPDLRAIGAAEVSVNKVLMNADPTVLRPFAEVFAEQLGTRVEHAFSAPFYFEATPAGIDKGSALRELAAARGLDAADSVAFGDNFNDLPMLAAAGLGVAMANATAAVRDAADRVTASNDDEGIAAVLADLFGQGEPAPAVPEPQDQQPLYALDLREIGGLVHADDR